ncbi:hypothetical protein [Flavobacterium fluviatile]|uniref:hypothetical protein n=1 Tax=Flavobacterium fluviatile TaxID=1862387 RepID=UPI0013D5B1B4|nr:hypothetical protein [Flavobacterium fluviatile]
MAYIDTVKEWFKTGLKPTQAQFWAKFGYLRWKDEKIPVEDIQGIEEILNDKAEAAVLTNHLTDTNAHALQFEGKEDKENKGEPDGYAPLNEFAKIASQYLDIVNDLVTGGATSLLSAEQGKNLQNQINGINTILTSNDVNLDTVQELVNAIKTVQTSLSTILVNDLTTGGVTKAATAETVKILKGLIDSLTTVVNGKLSNIITTVKTITSASLVTQDVAGFVQYINALSTPLVVAANETVEYQLSDTGKVFKLLLRGRSFGTGQTSITATDVEDTTLWMNKDLKLSNYSNARNDGALPTNKILSPDANGNLKLYTMATAPAPFIEELIPDSHLPNATGNIELIGEFFIPAMCLAANLNNANGIQITGQTINYATFVNSQKILMNVTTGSAEGSFSITCNNGLSTTKNNALLIILGDVFAPVTSDWSAETGAIGIDNNNIQTIAYGSTGSAIWEREFDWTKDFEVRMLFNKSPLGSPISPQFPVFQFLNVSDNSNKLRLEWNFPGNFCQGRTYLDGGAYQDTILYSGSITSLETWNNQVEGKELKIKWLDGVFTIWHDGVLKRTFTNGLSQNVKLKVNTIRIDILNIKYIELAT